LVLPAHSWDLMEQGIRVFDVRQTPSCVGTIAEQFRKMPGVQRSLHPTHSVAAIGPLASYFTTGHENCSTPCGADSPYEKLLNQGGQILFLGVNLDSNTAFHTVEAIGDVSYLMKPEPEAFTIIDAAGNRKNISLRRHQSSIPRRFGEWEDVLFAEGFLKRGAVGNARSLLLDGQRFLDFMLDRVRKDPNMFLSSSPE
jgi:aminoglycoside 3-N-acetyltransferase